MVRQLIQYLTILQTSHAKQTPRQAFDLDCHKEVGGEHPTSSLTYILLIQFKTQTDSTGIV